MKKNFQNNIKIYQFPVTYKFQKKNSRLSSNIKPTIYNLNKTSNSVLTNSNSIIKNKIIAYKKESSFNLVSPLDKINKKSVKDDLKNNSKIIKSYINTSSLSCNKKGKNLSSSPSFIIDKTISPQNNKRNINFYNINSNNLFKKNDSYSSFSNFSLNDGDINTNKNKTNINSNKDILNSNIGNSKNNLSNNTNNSNKINISKKKITYTIKKKMLENSIFKGSAITSNSNKINFDNSLSKSCIKTLSSIDISKNLENNNKLKNMCSKNKSNILIENNSKLSNSPPQEIFNYNKKCKERKNILQKLTQKNSKSKSQNKNTPHKSKLNHLNQEIIKKISSKNSHNLLHIKNPKSLNINSIKNKISNRNLEKINDKNNILFHSEIKNSRDSKNNLDIYNFQNNKTLNENISSSINSNGHIRFNSLHRGNKNIQNRICLINNKKNKNYIRNSSQNQVLKNRKCLKEINSNIKNTNNKSYTSLISSSPQKITNDFSISLLSSLSFNCIKIKILSLLVNKNFFIINKISLYDSENNEINIEYIMYNNTFDGKNFNIFSDHFEQGDIINIYYNKTNKNIDYLIIQNNSKGIKDIEIYNSFLSLLYKGTLTCNENKIKLNFTNTYTNDTINSNNFINVYGSINYENCDNNNFSLDSTKKLSKNKLIKLDNITQTLIFNRKNIFKKEKSSSMTNSTYNVITDNSKTNNNSNLNLMQSSNIYNSNNNNFYKQKLNVINLKRKTKKNKVAFENVNLNDFVSKITNIMTNKSNYLNKSAHQYNKNNPKTLKNRKKYLENSQKNTENSLNFRENPTNIYDILSPIQKNTQKSDYTGSIISCNKIKIKLKSNYGNSKFIGLTGVLFYDEQNKIIPLEKASAIGALPKDINSYFQYSNDMRIFENVFNETNETNDENQMWLTIYNKKEPSYFELFFQERIKISKIKIFNYNSANELDKCTREIDIFIDDHLPYCPLYYENFIIRQGIGEGNVDYSQDITFPIIDKNKEKITDLLNKLHRKNRNFFAGLIYKQIYETPYMPCGLIVQISLFKNSGDWEFIGLNNVEFYDNNGEKIKESSYKIESNYRMIRDEGLLMDYVNTYTQCGDDKNENKIYFFFEVVYMFSVIKIFNYRKINIGAKDIKVYVDNYTVFEGNLQGCSSNNDRGENIILFSCEKKIISKLENGFEQYLIK